MLIHGYGDHSKQIEQNHPFISWQSTLIKIAIVFAIFSAVVSQLYGFQAEDRYSHYTIVLTPPSDQGEKAVKMSRALANDHQSEYLLNSDGTSSPHVTLVQFDCSSDALIKEIWQQVKQALWEQHFTSMDLSFTGVASIEGAGRYQGTTWIELSVENSDELRNVQDAVLKILQSFEIDPLNAVGKNYRPHETLTRVSSQAQIEIPLDEWFKEVGKFQLELGQSDEKWQYANRLEVFHPNVSDLDLIYNHNGYSFNLPRPVMESYFDGKAFDQTQSYQKQEREQLIFDIQTIYEEILSKNPVRERRAILTAGAPGAGKTILLEQEIARRGANLAYVDPDAVCLVKMRNTYLVEQNYTKWRPASNAACLTILANLIREEIGFYLGTTCTAPQSWTLLNLLKQRGYQIEIIHLAAPDEVRLAAIQQRSSSFVQVTDEDVIAKGKLLSQRIQDTYLKYADKISFYYRGDANANASLAAIWTKGEKLVVVNETLLNQIRKIHNEASQALNREDLLWHNQIT